VDRAFRQVARDKGLEFRISMERDLPPAIRTDAKRLRQILKKPAVQRVQVHGQRRRVLEVAMVSSGWTPGHAVLDEAGPVVAFSVIDTGIGIAPEKQQIIFERSSRPTEPPVGSFGGTGLGLSISTELTRLLGGDIKVQSSPARAARLRFTFPLCKMRKATTAILRKRFALNRRGQHSPGTRFAQAPGGRLRDRIGGAAGRPRQHPPR